MIAWEEKELVNEIFSVIHVRRYFSSHYFLKTLFLVSFRNQLPGSFPFTEKYSCVKIAKGFDLLHREYFRLKKKRRKKEGGRRRNQRRKRINETCGHL